MLANDINIEHACEKSCACTTCHVLVREGIDSLNEAAENEEDMLDKAWGLEAESRLSCQSIVGTRRPGGRNPEVHDQPRRRKNH